MEVIEQIVLLCRKEWPTLPGTGKGGISLNRLGQSLDMWKNFLSIGAIRLPGSIVRSPFLMSPGRGKSPSSVKVV